MPAPHALLRLAVGSLAASATDPDAELLERFIADRDEAAFRAIVTRHGPMVWAVCRRALGDHHRAEDAYQAVFLVLVRKALTVAPRSRLGNWLYGVAYNVAWRAARAARRAGARAEESAGLAAVADPRIADAPDDWADHELARLPAWHREPLVLCVLQGRTIQEAAMALGCPVGTLASRLARARQALANRLRKRGLVPAAAFALLESAASATSTAPCSVAITRLVLGAAGTPPAVLALTNGVLAEMAFKQSVRLATCAFTVAVAVAAFGLSTTIGVGRAAPPAKSATTDPKAAPLTATDLPAPATTPTFTPTPAEVEEGRRLAADVALTSLAGDWEVVRGTVIVGGVPRELTPAEVRRARLNVDGKGFAKFHEFDLGGYDEFAVTLDPTAHVCRINFYPTKKDQQKRFAAVYDLYAPATYTAKSPPTLKLAINLTPGASPPKTVGPVEGGIYLVLARNGKNPILRSAFEADEPFLNDREARSPKGPQTEAPKQPAADPPGGEDEAERDGLRRVRPDLLNDRKVLIAIGCDLTQADRILDRMERVDRRGRAAVEKARAVPAVRPGAGDARDLLAAAKAREAVSDAYSEWAKELRVAATEVVDTVLTTPQRRRLRQIQLQAAGHEAFLWPEVEKALGLTNEQRRQVADAHAWAQGQAEAMADAGDAEAAGRGPFGSRVRRAATDRVVGLLTDVQKATWRRLTGEPFAPPGR